MYGSGAAAVHALRGVDLEVPAGELIVLLGASGSGKSTLLNILGGLDRATDGTAHFFDQDLTAMSDHELTLYRRHHVGFVFQFYNLMPSLTALENVELVTEIAERPLDAAEALALVGLKERIDHFPAQLSGGEQQRVAIARAIASERTGPCSAMSRPALDRRPAGSPKVSRTSTASWCDLIITCRRRLPAMADRVIRFFRRPHPRSHQNTTKKSAADIEW